ncbi:hypothetical protein SLE2022_022380 [Rubroshorea leprosula]
MATMVMLGSIASFLAAGDKTLNDEKVAIFPDALNHASIIDGICLAGRQRSIELFVYRHCDMSHLNALLCKMKKKVVVTDSLFSMDGDFAPMIELAELRKKHNFLFVIDDAHGTFVCGKNGGGVADEFHCERDVDICIGTLSKAAGCHGGFIACSKRWKQLIQSRGRSFIFSTSTPVPVAASAHVFTIRKGSKKDDAKTDEDQPPVDLLHESGTKERDDVGGKALLFVIPETHSIMNENSSEKFYEVGVKEIDPSESVPNWNSIAVNKF